MYLYIHVKWGNKRDLCRPHHNKNWWSTLIFRKLLHTTKQKLHFKPERHKCPSFLFQAGFLIINNFFFQRWPMWATQETIWILPDRSSQIALGSINSICCFFSFFFPVIANNVHTIYDCARMVIVSTAGVFGWPLCLHRTSGEVTKSPWWVAVLWPTCQITL